ncbi:L,D-transpeptidase family protein [Vibrio maerlii]|uniref:L,D-transpeptidase family protein n=1 Tax=Vibrio maerlii TaxID=2231648 RepID=UPI000E3D55FA|nr:L,D-transpeptidase family protein [Vibrio maerlii]
MRVAWPLHLLCITLLVFYVPKALALDSFYRLNWIDKESHVNQLIQYPQQLETLYENNQYQLIWYENNSVDQLFYQLQIVDKSRLGQQFTTRLNWLEHYLTSNRQFEFDLLATDTLILYLNYAEEAPLSGRDWYLGAFIPYTFPEPSYELMYNINQAVMSDQLVSVLMQGQSPLANTIEFESAWFELLEQQSLPEINFSHKGLLRMGDTLEPERRDVLIELISRVGIDTSLISPNLSRYDRELNTAVKRFQKLHGLKQDGIIGPNTLSWLNKKPEERLRLLALNAERSRLWPVQRDKIILVNVPSFQLEYWQGGEELFASKVVVGRKSRKTPLLNISLDSLVLNPSWNVPWKIMVKDILPKMKYNQGYLNNNNFKVIKSWSDRTTVDVSEFDWNGTSPYSFPYRLQQQPGNKNALGLYKFNTPNARAIYLHDTPSRHLFNEDVRAFSSGCIRVQYAENFATTLLESQGMNVNRLTKARAQSPLVTQSVRLRSRIPVHIIYQTAWVEAGLVNYRHDVYNYDG